MITDEERQDIGAAYYEDGFKAGKKEGLEKGREQGIEQGIEDGLVQSARKMIDAGFPKEEILKVLGLKAESL